jgi:hypothetical protein
VAVLKVPWSGITPRRRQAQHPGPAGADRAPPSAPARGAVKRPWRFPLFPCKSILYGAFVWARRALNGRKRRFPARDNTTSRDL